MSREPTIRGSRLLVTTILERLASAMTWPQILDTFIVKQQPYKLVYLTNGNPENRQLPDLFRANWSILGDLLTRAHVIEINQQGIKIWL